VALPESPRAAIGVILDAPEPGHYAVRLGRLPPKTKGARYGAVAPWVPALIYSPCPWVEADPYEDYPPPQWWCEPTGRAPGPLRARIGERDVEDTKMILVLWQSARAVPPHEYLYLVARRAWARRYDPESYHAKPVDLTVLKNREVLF
jgi:hypothetical protein